MDYDALLNATTKIGFSLLENGADIYRVEESIKRIFTAYGVKEGDVFAVPSCLIVTICTQEEYPITKIKRVYSKRNDLRKIELLNNLCREICATTPDVSYIYDELNSINNSKSFGLFQQTLGFSLVAFAFTLFYGGNIFDALCAILAGAAVKIVYYNMERFQANTFFIIIISSATASLVAVFTVKLGLANNIDKITIGTLMNLVPGIVLTSFMRDVIAGDLFAGLTKFTEAILIATAIAIGSGIVLTIFASANLL